MVKLYDKYEMDTSIEEKVTPDKEQEVDDFLHAVLDTKTMELAMNFLQKKGFLFQFSVESRFS